MKLLPYLLELTSGPPPAAHACPLGLKRHSRRDDAFKEGRCIQGGKLQKSAKTYYAVYDIDHTSPEVMGTYDYTFVVYIVELLLEDGSFASLNST